MKTIILAGGSGTRLWPLSRERFPKQFIKFNGKKHSLFQETFKRSALISKIEDIFIVTNINYKFLVMGEVEELGFKLNEENIIVEPEAKNTLPAIYAGVHQIIKKEHDLVIVFPSDHIIDKNMEFVDIIKKSSNLAKSHIITFGIEANNPNTGYGYISCGDKILNGFIVDSFKEKPTKEKAELYINEGYLWNAGIFMFNSQVFVNETKKYALDIYEAFETSDNIKAAFSKIINKISVDYGLLEKSKKIAVVPADIGWNDLGSFDSFQDVFQKDENENIFQGNNIIIDSKNNLINSYDNKVVATIGVDDLIIIDSRDALLVCKKNQSQKVKDVVNVLKERKDSRTEYSIQDYRPWGSYKILEEEEKFKIKKITVGPGKKLSYQKHIHRSEHWIVINGIAKVTIENEIIYINPGESIFIRKEEKHRLENEQNFPLEIIEVQMGNYLGEDDIIRFDDLYGRE